MYIYKFRLLYDEIEGFVRDYEIGAKQTFKDFHDIILKSIPGLDPKELASFYICDRKWNKLKARQGNQIRSIRIRRCA